MLFKRLPFELVMINPGSKGDNDLVIRLSGENQVDYSDLRGPTGFTLGEARDHDLLIARSRWTDVYPSDEQQRARVDQYLHYHRNVRETSLD